MNLILFRQEELEKPLSRSDARAKHIRDVLHCDPGDSFDAGVVNGLRGKACILDISDTEMTLTFSLQEAPPPLFPLTLVAGLSRPQTCRDILREATSLGVGAICFAATDRAERAYSRSRIWRGADYKRYLIAGAEQAFTTRVPSVSLFDSLDECLRSLSTEAGGADRLALDNYEAALPLRAYKPAASSCILAIGAERGWSGREREQLRDHSFALASLGHRILRTETACVVAIALVLARRGLM